MRWSLIASSLLIAPLAAADGPPSTGAAGASTTPAAAEDAGWDTPVSQDGLTVRSRQVAGTSVREILAEGVVEGSVPELRDVLTDTENLPKYMPYMTTSRLLKKETDGSEMVYVVIDPPIIGQRDYIVRSRVENDSAAEFRNSWVAMPDYLPQRAYIRRIRINQGYWLVRPDKEGHVRVQHSFRTDPGGWIPSYFVNLANQRGVSDLYKAVQTEVLRRRVAREQAVK